MTLFSSPIRIPMLTAFLLVFLFLVMPFEPVLAQGRQAVSESKSLSLSDAPSIDTQPVELAGETSEAVTEPSKAEQTDRNLKPQKDKLEEEKKQENQNSDLSLDSLAAASSGAELKSGNSLVKTLPAPSLPEVDASSGVLNYVFPFALPPGRAGLTPEFALRYDSQKLSEESPVGVGWEFKGLPFLQRLNKNGTDILYGNMNVFSSLNGELMAAGANSFRAKVEDGSSINYIFDSANSSFTAASKDGNTYVYGAQSQERQDDPQDSTRVYKWLISEIRDPNSNFIKFQYFKDQGQIYPDRIFYSGNGADLGNFEVIFNRESANYPVKSFRQAFLSVTAFRIKNIEVKVNNQTVRRYDFSYTTGQNTKRQMLASITQSGFGDNGQWVSLPATVFEYQTNSGGASDWQYQNIGLPTYSYTCPTQLPTFTVGGYLWMVGSDSADFNGDAIADIAYASNLQYYTCPENKMTFLGTGSGFIQAPQLILPVILYDQYGNPGNVVLTDLNGDGLTDIAGGNGDYSLLNTGSGFVQSPAYKSVGSFNDTFYHPGLMDLNGDGLADYYARYNDEANQFQKKFMRNTGQGFAEDPPFNDAPTPNVDYVYYVDLNGDGLLDKARHTHKAPGGSGAIPEDWNKSSSLNVGNQSFVDAPEFTPPMIMDEIWSNDNWAGRKALLADLNGDGLADFFGQQTFINTGNSWLPVSFPTVYEPYTGFLDYNGDGLLDIVKSNGDAWINKQKPPDLLVKITYPAGGFSSISYKPSSQAVNTKLPYALQTVDKIITSSGSGNVSTDTYVYENGFHYFDATLPLERKFSGFNKVIKIDATGGKVSTYFHQGNASDSANGEFSDHPSKIGKPYRVEVFDSAGNLYQTTINKWESVDLGSGRSFVKLAQSLKQSFDGNVSHKDTAESFVYNDTNGNLLQKTEWGEVSGNSDGSFVDVGFDKRTTDYLYAVDPISNFKFQISNEATTDQNNQKIKETKYYYDGLPLGQLNQGNLTKQENWVGGTIYINIQKTYNSYGLVASEIDPRGKVTAYTYDSFNLYPVSITNPLNQTTNYEYDYGSGQVKKTTDPNGLIIQTLYDGLGRPLEERQSDILNPLSLILKTAHTHTDTPLQVTVKRTDYLTPTLTVDFYTYFDGLNRPVQNKKSAENSQFTTLDTLYDQKGRVAKESLSYSSPVSSRTSATTDPSLYTTYTYDALNRIFTSVNAIGTASYAYDNWQTTLTDPKSIPKDLIYDAYGRLVQVNEHNGQSIYQTSYQYDGSGNLTQITDALGNVRQFSYDSLGRRLTAEDLHAQADATFGVWNYNYDEAGNLLQSTDPKDQIVNYVYDDLNRVLIEDFTGQTGTEVSYVYDACPNGIGRLCTATTASAATNYTYDVLGRTVREVKNINSVNYQTDYGYDNLGNLTQITNPDSSKVQYFYNSAGLIEKIQRKEASQASFSDIVTNLDYVPTDKPSLIAYANGVTTTNAYDSTKLYRLTQKRTLDLSGQVLHDLAYTYDANGNITQILDSSATNAKKTADYSYDDLNRLISAAITNTANNQNYTQTYAYSPIGNIISKSDIGAYTYAGTNFANPHATTSIGGKAHTYDQNGNLLSDSSLNHAWNYKNQLVQTILPATVVSTTTTTTTVSFYSTTGDGSIYHNSSTSWDVAHDATTGSSADYTSSTAYVRVGKTRVNKFQIERAFLLFDTKTLPDNANLVSAKLKVYVSAKKNNDNDGDDWITVTQTSQPSTSCLTTADYDLAGSINKPKEGIGSTERKDITSVSTGKYLTFNLNRTGLSWISKTGFTKLGLREGHDVKDSPFVGTLGKFNELQIRTANYSGTASDPVLEITYTTTSTPTPSAVTYGYDHTGQRVKMVNGSKTTVYPSKSFNTDGTAPTKHIFAGDMMVATITGSNASSTVQYIHTDHLSGSNVITSNTGSITELLDYYPYGAIRLDEKTTSFNEQRKYIGEYYDEDTALSYLNARYYDGARGQFISQDPVHLAIGSPDIEQLTGERLQEVLADPQVLNSYSYARNNPIVKSDPSGKCPMCILAVGTLAMYAPQITNFAQSLITPLGQFGIAQATEDFEKSNYGWAVFGFVTAGEAGMMGKASEVLYHGTTKNRAISILKEGFKLKEKAGEIFTSKEWNTAIYFAKSKTSKVSAKASAIVGVKLPQSLFKALKSTGDITEKAVEPWGGGMSETVFSSTAIKKLNSLKNTAGSGVEYVIEKIW